MYIYATIVFIPTGPRIYYYYFFIFLLITKRHARDATNEYIYTLYIYTHECCRKFVMIYLFEHSYVMEIIF